VVNEVVSVVVLVVVLIEVRAVEMVIEPGGGNERWW
jgi:hypothetical protein